MASETSGARLRMELFVADVAATVAFYEEAFGFHLVRGGPGYSSIRRGDVVLGLGPVSNLPERDDGPGHSREKVARAVGAGVEIVLELDGGADAVVAAHDHVVALGLPVAEPPLERPWGLWDFRLADPDGYYLRVTHGDAREE